MAILETTSNPPPPPSSLEPGGDPNRRPSERKRVKVRAGKFGEVDQDELIHLLESYDDERQKGRFPPESI